MRLGVTPVGGRVNVCVWHGGSGLLMNGGQEPEVQSHQLSQLCGAGRRGGGLTGGVGWWNGWTLKHTHLRMIEI